MSALEWRARWISDPVDRLQFLRRKLAVAGKRSTHQNKVIESLPAIIAFALAIAAFGLFFLSSRHVTASAHSVAPPPAPLAQNLASPVAELPAPIWLVKNTAQFDLYSNGLRVENQYAASTAPRRYLAFARLGNHAGPLTWRLDPAGIVFHTTESHIAPFEEDQNQTLQRAGEGLLEYVNRSRAYHFVIDRFGRVFRVVRESDYANHAGNSVWADDASIYLNLNHSFFGVAFEAQSTSGTGDLPLLEAQVHAGRVLTDMLRARYRISADNCISHAQVSVNPDNARAGFHVDWAANLPFGALGLADNYRSPLASVALFGFQAGEALAAKGGAPLAVGIAAAEEQVQRDAALEGLSTELYCKTLQKRYRDAIRALRENAARQPTTSEEYN